VCGVYIERLNAVVVVRDGDEHFERLPLDFLLAADVQDNLVEHVERYDSGVDCAGGRLHRLDEHGFNGPEGIFECSQGDNISRGRTVGVGYDEALFEGRQT